MKILMLTPYLPYPPSVGGQLRSYHLIKELSKSNDITLVCFTREHNSPEHLKHVQTFCKKVLIFERGKAWTIPNILRTGFSLYPFLVSIYYSPEIKVVLQTELTTGNYDLIHAETFYVMPYLPPHKLPVVLAEQTIMSRVFEHYVQAEANWLLKPLYLIDVAKIRYWEKYYWKKVDRLIAVSEEDANIMKSEARGLNVNVVPNGVGEDFSRLQPKLHYNQTILYQGNYKWLQNWEAATILATKVFPLIKSRLPNSKLIINGQFPTKQLKALASDDIIISEHEDTDSAAVVKAYSQAGLLVAPIYGPGGTRLKILAAMASMVPVVTTPLGAEGYGAVEGKSILVGTTPKELASKAIQVLTDIKLYSQIATQARKLVDTKFTWGPIAKNLESIYQTMIYEKKN